MGMLAGRDSALVSAVVKSSKHKLDLRLETDRQI